MSRANLQATGRGLSLSGLRAAPLDPKAKAPQVGTDILYKYDDPARQRVPKFLNKERSGFSGGFKIPEEQRKAKLGRKIRHDVDEGDEDQEELQKNELTIEEIKAHLNLGAA